MVFNVSSVCPLAEFVRKFIVEDNVRAREFRARELETDCEGHSLYCRLYWYLTQVKIFRVLLRSHFVLYRRRYASWFYQTG